MADEYGLSREDYPDDASYETARNRVATRGPLTITGIGATPKGKPNGGSSYEIEPDTSAPATVGATKTTAAPNKVAAAYELEPDEQTVEGAVSHLAVGLGGRGITRALGMPVDTARQAIELGKAALGTATHAVTGADIPDWLQPASEEETAKDVGSTEWWRGLTKASGGEGFLTPHGAETGLNRGLAAAGEGVVPGLVGGGGAATVLPRTVAATATAGAAGAAAGAASEAVGNDNPALSATASLLAGAAGGHAAGKLTAPRAKPAPPPPPTAPTGGYTAEEIYNAPVPARFQTAAEPSAAAGGPTTPAPAAAAPTAPEVSHTVNGNVHTVTTPEGGRMTAVHEPEQGRMRVTDAFVPPEARGQKHGIAMAERLLKEAGDRGAVLHSDNRVSEPEQHVYDALARRGHTVVENPNEKQGSGEKLSASELRGVYEVHPRQKLAVDLSGEKSFSTLSAEKSDLTPEQNAARTAELERHLKAFGIPYTKTRGNHKGHEEDSFAVDTSHPQARALVEGLAQVNGQESVLHVDAGGNSVLRYADGHTEPVGKWAPVDEAHAKTLDAWTRDAHGNYYATTPKTVEAKPTPAAKVPTAKPISFAPPTREDIVEGTASPAAQKERTDVLRQLQPFGLHETRTSAITGNTADAGTDYQTAKLTDHPHGQRIGSVIANERTALSNYADDLVRMSGGSRGLDQIDRQNRGRTLTEPVEDYEAHLEDLIKQHYAIATERAQGRPFQLDGVAHLLANERAQFLGTTEGKQLLEGVNARAKELGLLGPNGDFNPATVEQAERFRQYLNDNWTPRTSRLIGQLKGALDLDVAKTAGEDIFAKAREIRSLQGTVLEEPVGVQALRKPDDRLGINRPVALEDIPKHLATLPLEQLHHLLDVYDMAGKVSPAAAAKTAAARNELRSHFANEVRAAGLGGNTPGGVWNVKAVNEYLNKNVGAMTMLFKPEELARFKTLNDAGTYLRMNTSYPGAKAQEMNLAARGTLGAIEHGATGAGALVGHAGGLPGAVVGAAIGHGASKAATAVERAALGRAVEKRITKLEPPTGPNGGGPGETPLGQTAAGKSQSGAIGTRKAGASKSEPMVTLRHFSREPNLTTIDPNRQGTGTRGTNAERNRSTKVSSFYPDKMTEDQPEKLVTQGAPHQYTAQVPKSRLYDAVNDPDGLRKGKSFDAYEAAIKKAGYIGYHVDNPDYPLMHGQARLFESVPATKVGGPGGKPLGQSAFGKGQRGSVGWTSTPDAPKPIPIEEINKHLTPEEQKQTARKNVAANVVNIFHELPPTHELAAAALAGQAKRGWYRDAARAINTVFGADAPRFTAVLAALSPQTSVQSNFHNAVRTFINWDNAGRPQDPAAIKKIMGASVQGNKGEDSVMEAWENNTVRALTHPHPESVPMLSGPKVDSFTQNLRDNVNAVTLDAWMAAFANISGNKLGGSLNGLGPGKSSTYLAYSAKVREAAAMLTHLTKEQWTPAEVQETVWSWAKAASEHADSAGVTKSIPELLKHKEITDELVRGTADFHNLFGDPGHRALIGGTRYASGLDELLGSQGSSAQPAGPSKKSAAAARALAPHLKNAAERLETVRQQKNAAAPGGKPVTQEERDAIENW